MQRLVTCLLILDFVSPCLSVRWILGAENTFYNVMDYGAHGDGKSDDSQALLSAWQNTCESQGTPTLVIPPNGVFMVRNISLNGPCKATSIYIQLQGKIVAPNKDAWVDGLKIVDNSKLIVISNLNGLTINGNGGLIDGYGSTWWECKSCQRPSVLVFHSCNDLTVGNLSIANSPRAHIKINGCEGATFSNINIRAPGDSPNTDGFDISSSKNIMIEDSTIESGDDCIAINGGSSYINVTGIACGPGHGISIGSLGRNGAHDTVEEVYVRNCSFTNTSNGARIKTWQGGSGYARKITFEQITLIQARNPIIINQYYNASKKVNQYIGSNYSTDGAVEVSEVTYRGFHGTSADNRAINLDCCLSGCFNIVLDQINIVTSKPGMQANASCTNAHGTATSTVPSCSCLVP